MNTKEIQKNVFDMLSEKQQNSKQYVYPSQKHGAVEVAQARNRQNQVLIRTANLGAMKPQADFTSTPLEIKGR